MSIISISNMLIGIGPFDVIISDRASKKPNGRLPIFLLHIINKLQLLKVTFHLIYAFYIYTYIFSLQRRLKIKCFSQPLKGFSTH